MPTIKATYLSPFREVTQKKEESITLQGRTLGSLVNMLIKRYGKAFQNSLFSSEGKPSIGIMIWVNGCSCLEFDTLLKNDDKVVFSMVVAGG